MPDLDEAEAQGGHGADGHGVLVEAGGETHRVGEAAAEEGLVQPAGRHQVPPGQGGAAPGTAWSGPQRGHAGAVGGLGIEAEEQAAEGGVAGHEPGGIVAFPGSATTVV